MGRPLIGGGWSRYHPNKHQSARLSQYLHQCAGSCVFHPRVALPHRSASETIPGGGQGCAGGIAMKDWTPLFLYGSAKGLVGTCIGSIPSTRRYGNRGLLGLPLRALWGQGRLRGRYQAVGAARIEGRGHVTERCVRNGWLRYGGSSSERTVTYLYLYLQGVRPTHTKTPFPQKGREYLRTYGHS